ncbi:MAG TPA: hypothetical protein VIY28_05285 [Pseudonocardiaceae bacterium]
MLQLPRKVHPSPSTPRARGESRWPAATTIVVAIALQITLPEDLVPPLQWLLPGLGSRWLLPGLELGALLVLIVLCPSRVDRESRTLRTTSLTLTVLLSLVNGWSAMWLVLRLMGLIHEGRAEADAGSLLLGTGASIWLTNIIAFGLWYWQFDRGGPAARAHARKVVPDFQFVQMQNPKAADQDWRPEFIDYLYLSFTNATAFSPTDVMPLSRWAKLTMLAQSLISLITMALVIARAVNILK